MIASFRVLGFDDVIPGGELLLTGGDSDVDRQLSIRACGRVLQNLVERVNG